ncbi:MAG: HAD family hydrolase [Armatimonadota bacterium]|nr:HAD family hydrolase [Armatimonadota bacterium]MDR7451208.1 HAD family hydrolase [Armatimonadota bacterium]MDR7467187.1 HAD family hydrolase [Armatimonadota bacterium]MDR7495200.1 HAD family hydrolase [Armatimonadota bacterium]MDR7500089.1 HAD family hydrolase [Armatimonadota bacterium]
MPALRAVCFDLDGTLLDSLASHHTVYRKVFADLGLPLPDQEYARHYSPNWYIFYERMGVPRDRWAEADRLWLRHYAEEAPRPRDGADEILAAVRASGCRLGLVTSGDRSRVERDIGRAGWGTAFDVVVCGGDVAERKPLPAPLRQALAVLGVAPAVSLYVGDTVEDVMMGKAAGTLTAAVLGGFADREVLQAAAPDYLLESLQELAVLVR